MNTLLALAALAATVAPAQSTLFERAAASDPSSFAGQSYDYVVVGAGPGGLAVASKLANDHGKKVAVVEAGLYLPNDPLIDVPKNFGLNNGNPKYDWRFNTTPQAELGGRLINHPRGKVVGGSTALNYMVFNRASKTEYDAWAEIGNDGWDWDSILPSFKSSSNYSAITDSEVFPSALNASAATSQEQNFIGTSGEIHASYNTYYTGLTQPFVLAMNSLGVMTNSAPDTGNTTGIYNTPTAVDRALGKRSYAAAYYASNLDNNNIVILTGAQATKINFSNNKRNNNVVATGITFEVNGTSYTVNANHEVILSAGAFQSPQLLELSGIGNSTILQAAGISSLVDLPGVGENLQDHAMSTQMWQVNDGVETWDQLRINQTFAQEAARQYNSTHDGPLASTISTLTFTTFQTTFDNDTALTEALTGLDTWISHASPNGLASKQYDIQKRWINESSVPGMEFVMVPMGGLTKTRPANGTSYLIVAAILQHPFSRGSVHINSSNPLDYPLIDPKYLTSPFDLAAITAGLTFANRLVSTEPLASLITTRIDPATNFTTSADFEGYVRASLSSIKHPTGTCAMAPQNLGGVVDSNLKVYGTDNVRVVDASIFPQHLAAHMQATVYAVGEKAADIIASGSSTGNTNDGARRGAVPRWALHAAIATGSLSLIFSLI